MSILFVFGSQGVGLVELSCIIVYESGATAWYLKDHAAITAGQIVMETTSYDTIGNAYFARTSHTEIRRWVRTALAPCVLDCLCYFGCGPSFLMVKVDEAIGDNFQVPHGKD